MCVTLEIKPDEKREILHAVRDMLNEVRKKDQEALVKGLKKIYRANSHHKAEEALQSLQKGWETKG